MVAKDIYIADTISDIRKIADISKPDIFIGYARKIFVKESAADENFLGSFFGEKFFFLRKRRRRKIFRVFFWGKFFFLKDLGSFSGPDTISDISGFPRYIGRYRKIRRYDIFCNHSVCVCVCFYSYRSWVLFKFCFFYLFMIISIYVKEEI